MTILAKFQCNWADEHDVYGFRTFESKEEVEKIFTYVQAWFEENPGEVIDLYFGTNEHIDLECFESFKESLTIIELTEEELETLKKLFGPHWLVENLIDYGWTGWADVQDYLIPWEENGNERLLNLADELWPPE